MPQNTAYRRWSCGRRLAASPITTALSPDNAKLARKLGKGEGSHGIPDAAVAKIITSGVSALVADKVDDYISRLHRGTTQNSIATELTQALT